ncbi:MAG: tetratricopeptide repeat protein [Candidatus Handelsmanbacteria bacterium]|nr:tetratricopeptide repeat protein [Candidatus Handelsmanbacteria bacterium]
MKGCWLLPLLFAGAAWGLDRGLQRFLETGELAGWEVAGRERGAQLFRQGQKALALGDTAAGRAALEQLTRAGSGPWTAAAWGLRAENALRADRLDEAERCLEEVCRQVPQTAAWTRLRRAELRYFQGKFAEAAAWLEELARQLPGDPSANDALALLALIEEHKDRAGPLQVLARAQLRLRQGRDAAGEWAQLEAEGVLQALALLIQARWVAGGDPAAALRLYERLAKEFPKSPHAAAARLEEAALREVGGELAEALAQYEAFLALFPEDARLPEVRLHIQRLRQQRGNQ